VFGVILIRIASAILLQFLRIYEDCSVSGKGEVSASSASFSVVSLRCLFSSFFLFFSSSL
jgi:hypothetical protein